MKVFSVKTTAPYQLYHACLFPNNFHLRQVFCHSNAKVFFKSMQGLLTFPSETVRPGENKLVFCWQMTM